MTAPLLFLVFSSLSLSLSLSSSPAALSLEGPMFSRSRCVHRLCTLRRLPTLLLETKQKKKTRRLFLLFLERSFRSPPAANETILFFPSLCFLPHFHPPRHNSAGAAATLRPAPRPFLLAGVFKSEEGGAGAGAAGGPSNPTSQTSSGGADAASAAASSSSADGVAAAAAAVLSLSPGATLGSVSDAAVCSSALWPGGCGGGGGGEEDADDDENEVGNEKQDDADEELNEWLARHTVDFLDAAALLQGALSHQFCTPGSCPAMRAGPRHEYLWAEPEIPGGGGGGGGGGREAASSSSSSSGAPPPPSSRKKKQLPSRLPARDYAAALFSWADALLACPHAFPQAKGEPFPPAFKSQILQPLYRRLARVFAHLYHAHWPHVADPRVLGAAAHLNTVFKHYVAFGREHGLLPEDDLDPVRPLVEALLPKKKPKEEKGGGGGEGLPPSSKAASTAAAGKAKGAATRRVEVSASSAAAAVS